MRIKEELATLKTQDIYSLILFALYKLKELPEYSTLSELVYLFDKETVLKLCQYFGGLTIKIPTISELETMVYSLVLYQQVDVDGMDFDKAIQGLGCTPQELPQIKADYKKLVKIMENYEINR